MSSDRAHLGWIWLATTLVVVTLSLLAYRSLTRIPEYAGRTDPAVIFEDPARLFTDPGLLGTAVEMRVTESVRACMESAGQTFRGPAAAEAISDLLDPATDGYGIAAGGEAPRPALGRGGPTAAHRTAYETALYGAPLETGIEVVGGCAAVGYDALVAAVNTLESLPYSIDQLEADALADPAYVAALEAWAGCMAERGYSATTPDDLIRAQAERLSTLSGDEARALGVEELQTAAADFACRRRTIDPATRQVAATLGPDFLDRNRAQLEALIPRSKAPSPPSGLGTGDVQVTLIWTSKADLDLKVTDPSSDVVFYGNRNAASGGVLDRDANFPCDSEAPSPAAENIYWPTGAAPTGSYQATVVYTSDCFGEGAQTFDLIVRVGGRMIHQQRYNLGSPGESVVFEFSGGSR